MVKWVAVVKVAVLLSLPNMVLFLYYSLVATNSGQREGKVGVSCSKHICSKCARASLVPRLQATHIRLLFVLLYIQVCICMCTHRR